MKRNSFFTRLAKSIAYLSGRPASFSLAVIIILTWAASGPIFGFSDTWQLVVNSSTSIITFLMVFLIQNTQNRDTETLQVKLDEIIRSVKGARKVLLDLEELDDKQLDQVRADYERLARRARRELTQAVSDKGSRKQKRQSRL